MSDASNNNDAVEILRIACPRSFQNSDIEGILSDPNFFIEENNGAVVLKRINMKDISQIVNCKWVFVEQVFVTLLFLLLTV